MHFRWNPGWCLRFMLPKQYRLQVRAVIPPHDCDSSSKCRSVPCDNQCLPACLPAFSNGFARRVASALPSMAKHLGEAVDPQWAEIALRLDPLPTIETNGTSALPYEPRRQIIVLAGNYTNITNTTAPAACGVTCGSRACGRSCPAQVAGDGMMDVMGACINHNHTDHLRVRACMLAACPLIT
eukprot:COSAG02_NODE_81_length_39811_cov_51.728898_13_plen_183_part_00